MNAPFIPGHDSCVPSRMPDLDHGERTRGVAYVLRCLSEGVQEAAAHPLAIAESGCAGDLFERQTTLLEHESGGFEPEIFDGLGG